MSGQWATVTANARHGGGAMFRQRRPLSAEGMPAADQPNPVVAVLRDAAGRDALPSYEFVFATGHRTRLVPGPR